MFIKRISKTNKTTGEYTYAYRLVESFRTDHTVRHQTILHLGSLAELPDVEQKRNLAVRINELVGQSDTGAQALFCAPDKTVETLAQRFYLQIKEKQRLDLTSSANFQRIDTDSVKSKDIREVGAEWLCLQALEQLDISSFLEQQDWVQTQIKLALTHIISRAVYPASELRTSQWIRQNSSVCELSGYPLERITKDKLYEVSHELYAVKDALEKHLSKRTNELFDLEDKIIIYDLTNTYFEGSMRSSKLARFGRSKEKRSDARLIVLAVVVNTEGFLKYSQIFEGNMADSKTLGKIIGELSERTSATARKPIVVLDAGIASSENLALLRKNKFDYMCVSRSGMNKYSVDATCKPIRIMDQKKQPITLQRVKVEDSSDTWLRIHSPAKAAKETGMNSRFSQRFEQGLAQIQESLGKKSGVKKQDKVWERIGRLKAKYPSMGRHYQIDIAVDDRATVTQLTWKQKPVKDTDGYYLLRTTLCEKDEQVQWTIYNTIREIEATFRVLKTDLDLRPVFHKTDQAALAHLHLGLLAYWVVNTVRYQLKQKGINNEWRDIVRIMNTQKIVTTTMENDSRKQIIIRQCSEPTVPVEKIYAALNYKYKPFARKKSVVPPPEMKNDTRPEFARFSSG